MSGEPNTKRVKIASYESASSRTVLERSRPERRQRPKLSLSKLLQLEMPLEMTLEVFSNLQPLDLLHLSRTCKSLRRIMLNRKFAWVWKSALQGVDGYLPCPMDMSEPSFASLAFDHHCSECGAKGIRKPFWVFRTRLCKTCRPRLTTRYNPFPIIIGDKTATLLSVFVNVDVLRSIFESFKETVQGQDFYYVPCLNRVTQWISDNHGDRYFGERLQLMAEAAKEVKEHAQLCAEWQKEMKRKRALELDRIRSERTCEIYRLLSGGEYYTALRHHWVRLALAQYPPVREPRKLTTREWTKIRGSVENHVDVLWEKFQEWVRQASLKKVMALAYPSVDVESPHIKPSQYEEFRGFLNRHPDMAAENYIKLLLDDGRMFSHPIINQS